MTFCDGRSVTILVTQYNCHYYTFMTKTHIFSDDNGSSRIVKSLVVRYSREEISDVVVFSRVQRLLKNVKKIPVVPGTFFAADPPKQVLDKSSRYVEIEYFTIL